MKMLCVSFFKKALSDQRGQTLPLVALGILSFVGVAGLSIDVGHAYVVRSQLQNATNAAVLAGAGQAFYAEDTSNAISTATQYLGLNAVNGLTVNSGYPSVTTPCLTSLLAGGSCGSSSGGNSTTPNAIKAVTQVKVPTYFMALLGVHNLNVGAESMATLGGSVQPWNLAIILDATPSMANPDSYCGNITAEQCALKGIQTLLETTPPCVTGVTSCTPNSPNTLFRVSLFSFPNVSTAQVANDYTGGSVSYQPYTLPQPPPPGSTVGYQPLTYSTSGHSPAPWTGTYQITMGGAGAADSYGFLSDYYTTTGNHLNSSSILVQAVGNGSTNGKLTEPGSTPSGGQGGVTYFAAALYAAQAALQAEQAQVTALGIQSKNAIIFVSDGQANAGTQNFPSTGSKADTVVSPSSSGYINMNANGTGIYPATVDACQQAMVAANYAKQAGTRVYGVAYGSETNGCTNTTNGVESGVVIPAGIMSQLNVHFTTVNQIIPCLVIENIASDLSYFYTDGTSNHNGCTATTNTSTSLTNIFTDIRESFTAPRLIPNSTT